MNPENGDWVRPLPEHVSLGEETSPATLLAVGITSFYRDRAGEHPWSTSVREGFVCSILQQANTEEETLFF